MREAAVLVPLFRDEKGELRLVLIARSDVGIHGGQVSFPGGKRESGDDTPLDTALREAEEEIGLQRHEIEVISDLDPLDTRTTGYRVYPFLARLRMPAHWRLREQEVAAVLVPSVESLADPARRAEAVLSFPSWPEQRRVDQVGLCDGHTVWGLTLRLLDNVLPRIHAGEWEL